jgi:broad specificity phosphatase PhoE
MLKDDPTSVPASPESASGQAGNVKAGPTKRLYLVRHGQTTFNVERRLPGQLPGVLLTDEGRRQAQQAAVALSAVPVSAVVSSPLERARDTAEIIARGWALPIRLDARLVDTDVGRWTGMNLDDLAKSDREWTAFVRHTDAAPPGVERLTHVMARAVESVQDIRGDPSAGDNILLVAHADIVKLIIGHYLGMHPDLARAMRVDNASISILDLHADETAALIASNWTAFPDWLVQARATSTGGTQAPGGVQTAPTEGASLT